MRKIGRLGLGVGLVLALFSCEETPEEIQQRKAGELLGEMAYVEAGAFLMGSNADDALAQEKPVHRVELDAYYIGEKEVTVSEFEEFVEAENYFTDADTAGTSMVWKEQAWVEGKGVNWKCNEKGDIRSLTEYDYPVTHVTWDDAMAYCEWLSKETGLNCSLPTEAQWEYAAKGGEWSNAYDYSGSDDVDDVAWYYSNSSMMSAETGKKKANELRLYDMSGNVWEYCLDWYGDYAEGDQTNPQGPSEGTLRVVRGGSWMDQSVMQRPTARVGARLKHRSCTIGFRIVVNGVNKEE